MKTTAERFEAALEKLAREVVGENGNSYAYMAGYMFSLLKEMSGTSDRAALILNDSIRNCEKNLFERKLSKALDEAT